MKQKLWHIVLLAALLSACAAIPAPPERVLVAGATGRAGTFIRDTLRDEGYEVLAMTRSVPRAIERHGAEWRWVEADVRDREQVAAAMEGADYVISAIGAREREGPNGPEFVDFGGVRNLVEAARAARVKQFVLISSAAAGVYRQRSRMIEVGNIRYWKTQGENVLKTSGLPYTIIGPGGLENEPSSGQGLRILTRRDYDTGLIAIGDVAMLAVNALENPDARNKTFAAIRDKSVPRGAWPAMLAAIPEDRLSDERVDP